METTPGPVYEFSMACNGEAGCYTFNSNSAFFQNASNTVIEFRSDGTSRDISRADYNNLVATDKYLYRMGGDKFTRVDLVEYQSTEVTEVPRALGVRGVYAVNDTVISYSADDVVGGSQISLSHDAGNTWESFFFETGLDKHLFTDVEDNELVVTLSSNVGNVVTYQLVEG
jgi:hypothetical protein